MVLARRGSMPCAMHRARRCVHDMRGGKLGPITFETVAEWIFKQEEAIRLQKEAEEAQLQLEADAAKKALENQNYRKSGESKYDA